MFEGYIAGKFANKFFEKDIFNTIKRHALTAALILTIPDFGLGTIFFAIILWHMYSSICTKVGISFSEHFWRLVGIGFFVNVLVALFLDVILAIAFFLEGFIIYFQFYLSGKLFVDSLKNSNIEVAQKNNNYVALPASLDKPSITLNSFGFATFACEKALDLTRLTDLKAWQVVGISEGSIKCKLITSPVAAGTGLLLTGVPGSRYSLFPTASGVNISGTNLLKGITINTRIEGNEYYGLRDNAFVPLDAGTIPAGKALLPVSYNCDKISYSIMFETSYNIVPTRGYNALFESLKELSVTLNSSGFATFACEKALDLTRLSDLKAWQVIEISGGSIICKLITSPVAAGTGILLTGVPGAHYFLLSTYSGADISGTNKLKGITRVTHFAGNEYYCLRDNAFVPLDTGAVPAGKALLPAQSINCDIKSLSLIFETSDNIIRIKDEECIVK